MATWTPWAVWALMRSFQVGVKVGSVPFLCPSWPPCTQPQLSFIYLWLCTVPLIYSFHWVIYLSPLKQQVMNNAWQCKTLSPTYTHGAPRSPCTCLHTHMYEYLTSAALACLLPVTSLWARGANQISLNKDCCLCSVCLKIHCGTVLCVLCVCVSESCKDTENTVHGWSSNRAICCVTPQ